jgi:membrane-bound lytic murein transglycosylase B
VVAAVSAAAVLVIAAAAGCGGGSDDAADEAAETTSTTAEPTTTAAPTTTTTVPFDPATLRPPAPAADPAALAQQIAAAEATIAQAGVAAPDLAAAGLAQQVAYRQLGDHPEWDAAVAAALPADLQPVAATHAAARRDLRALTGSPSTEMPAWRIQAPAPAADLVAWYHEAEAATGVPWQYLAAINLVETGMGRIHGLSTAGAQGPMQFLPSTWEIYGEGDIEDPHAAILAAGRLLAANGAPGDMHGALFSYNHDDRYVRAVTRYAELIAAHPGAYAGFHAWGIWYWTTAGDIYLPTGWESPERVPVDQYVAAHPNGV